ncbi:O-antigen ligase family protein [Olleya sp. HaHaR_3_96]|uniref:O-antigen ligase family protein n=1 Tax=Olleya sp. HaHaR_3_96 TaxID=2745560 RepID=UPI001C4ED745|nr:O-antigen ligase family protein [Olleya sp. HaHaR_3_96]QXP60667.1 O-antigen ligase family protein [Olleya sp. HaHaR_3_96]
MGKGIFKDMNFVVKKYSNSFFFFAICFVAISINFPKHSINSISIIVLCIAWLFNGVNLKKKFVNFLNNKTAILFSFVFFCYCIGLVHTQNLDRGLRVVEIKLPLIIFPIILGSTSWFLSQKQKTLFSYLFIASNLLIGIFTIFCVYFDIGPVSERFIQTGIKYYSHSDLTTKVDNHPTYLSFSFLISLIFLQYLLDNNRIKKVVFIMLFILLSFYLFLLSSKLGVFLYLTLVIYFIYFKVRINKQVKLGLLIISVLTFFCVMVTQNPIQKRYKEEFVSIKSFKNIRNKEVPFYLKNQRLIAADIFFSQPSLDLLFGIGTGDTQDYLDKKYRRYLEIVNRGAFKDLNYHNQFFQLSSAIGFLGGILLIYVLLGPLCVSLKNGNEEYMLFLLLIFLFFLIESFFETQRGVVLYSFFNSLLAFLWYNKKTVSLKNRTSHSTNKFLKDEL